MHGIGTEPPTDDIDNMAAMRQVGRAYAERFANMKILGTIASGESCQELAS
jgi:hypothetical protein